MREVDNCIQGVGMESFTFLVVSNLAGCDESSMEFPVQREIAMRNIALDPGIWPRNSSCSEVPLLNASETQIGISRALTPGRRARVFARHPLHIREFPGAAFRSSLAFKPSLSSRSHP